MKILFEDIKESIAWQNRAYRFYLGSRVLMLKGPLMVNSSSLFLGYQAIESCLKAVLVFWDKSFIPKDAGHKTETMFGTYCESVPDEHRNVSELPECFTWTDRYQSLTRYPREDMFFVPVIQNYLNRLDRSFSGLIRSIPSTRWKSELHTVLLGRDVKELDCLRRKNKEMRQLRYFFGAQLSEPKVSWKNRRSRH